MPRGKRDTIYDIAVLNGNDPYRSIISIIDCGSECFGRLEVPFTYNDIKGAPLIDRIFNKFCTLLGKIGDTRASLYYYNASAKHDTAWITEQFAPSEKDYGIDFSTQ